MKNTLNGNQYSLPFNMNYIMVNEFLIAKVYLNSEEDELETKEAKHTFGTIIGYCECDKKRKGEVGFRYLVEPIDVRIHTVDKYLEDHNVEWTEEYKTFIDEKPEYIRMTTERQDRKTENLHT